MAAATGETIVALSSGQPPAAIAIVRTSGPHAEAAARRLAGNLPPPRQAALRALRDPRDGGLIDHGLVLRFPGPASATGEYVVEYQCHGGRAVVAALIDALLSCEGLRLAEPGEFTRRALANGRIDLTEAEGLADLLTAETELQRRVAIERASGGLRGQLEQWRERLLALSADAEVAIDYVDEDDGAAGMELAERAAALAGEMAALISAPPIERLRHGLRVVVAGPPNAGKSSLVNALARGERALVTAIPGTTRDAIEVPLAVDGMPIILVDTAGLRDSADEIEKLGIARSHSEVQTADLILWLGRGADLPPDRPAILVANKSDLGLADDPAAMAVSARTGDGLERLLGEIMAQAAALLPSPRALSLTIAEAEQLSAAVASLGAIADLTDSILAAEELRLARAALDRISGRAGVEEMLDALFGRFCLGK